MNQCCQQFTVGQAGATANPPMSYDSTLGTPTAQGIVPPYQNLPAAIYDVNGTADSFGWNPSTGKWT